MLMSVLTHVACGLDSLGLKSHLYGIVGDDDSGLAILDMLEQEGVETRESQSLRTNDNGQNTTLRA